MFDVITVFVIVALFGSKVCPCPRFRFIMRFRVVARNDSNTGALLLGNDVIVQRVVQF